MNNTLSQQLEYFASTSRMIDEQVRETIKVNASKELSQFLLHDRNGQRCTWFICQLLKRRFAEIPHITKDVYDQAPPGNPESEQLFRSISFKLFLWGADPDNILALENDLRYLLQNHLGLKLSIFHEHGYSPVRSTSSGVVIGIASK